MIRGDWDIVNEICGNTYIVCRTSVHQHTCQMTQDEFKTGRYDCILDLICITITVSILYDLI